MVRIMSFKYIKHVIGSVFSQNAVRDIAVLDVSLLVLIHCMEKIAKIFATVLLQSTVISCLDALRVSS